MKEFNGFIAKLGSVRSGLMGIAMIAVVFYHMDCWIGPHTILHAFKWGFIGVDVFLLVSGFGLCYSYEKHPLGIFYVRRLKRIFPLHIIEHILLLAAALALTLDTMRHTVITFVTTIP